MRQWPTIVLADVPVEEIRHGDVVALPSGSHRQVAQTISYPESRAGEHVVPACTALVYTNGHMSRGFTAGETVRCERWSDELPRRGS